MSRLARRAARLTAGATAATLLTAAFTAGAAGAATLGGASGPGAGAHLLSVPQGYDATADGYSMYNVTLGTGAQAYWNAGYTGQGVGVALIDSGVTQVAGLDSGNVVYGPDLSIDSLSSNLANVDSFGHGTHMAGIIAGRDAAAASPGSPVSPAGDSADFVGMAPGAHIVSVKVADTYGDTDVTQLIAAIDWVVAHKDDPGMNIRVINLSVGIDPSQSYQVDPLAYAVEQAWANGIVVVVAAGNDGTGKKGPGAGLQDPAYDPTVLAVGAADTNGTVDTHDDTVAAFSSTQGAGKDGDRKPDLVAPGEHIASLRDPGSWIDQNYLSTGGVTGNDRLMRGSGTSQATAVVSGAAALIISQHPDATPDQVKNLLLHATDHLDKADPGSQGNGELDLGKALGKKLDHWSQPRSHANGTGSLQADRPNGLVDPSGSQLSGEVDIFGNPISTADLAQAEAAGTGWTYLAGFSAGTGATGAVGSTNVGSAGVTVGGTSTSTDATSGHTWSGHTWSTGDWAGHTWSSDTWSGHTWSGHTWSGHTWSGHTWSASSWADGSWSSVVWQ